VFLIDECLDSLSKSLQLDPNNAQVKEDRKRIEKLINRQRKQQTSSQVHQTSSQAQQTNFSVTHRLSDACNTFEEGLNETRGSFGNPSMAHLQEGLSLTFTLKSGIENITNAIMNDERCFHCENDEGELMKKSIMMEYFIKKPLDPDTMSVEEAIRQYRIKKQHEGWDVVRRELTANVRVYFLLGINFRLLYIYINYFFSICYLTFLLFFCRLPQ
jgi:hypothetical protein